jgi:ribosomal protein L37E
MIDWIRGRLACFSGKHHRSGSKVHRIPDTDRFESVCAYCGVPMERLAKRKWVVKTKA